MGFGIDRQARSRKGRGLFRRAPDPRDVGERFDRLVRRRERDAVIRSGWKRERYLAELALHPAAPPVRVSVEPDAALVVRGETSGVGPGYQLEIAARIEPILDELDYVWAEPETAGTVQAQLTRWLADELRGEGQRRVGLPAERTFLVDAPVLTALGPRDDAWREAVLADPSRGADAFAWWERGPGREARSRALLAMWVEVPWREPLDKAERALMKRVDADLRAAHAADPELALPWPDWAALHAHLGIDDALAEEVRGRAGDAPARIGYRRHDLDVELSGGWAVRLPGSFVGSWEDDGARYWATDGDRSVEFTSLTAADEADSERLLAVAPELHPVIATLAEGPRRGRAEAYDDDDVRIVIGLVACAPHVGILTCKGGAGDEAWALATWRSLRQG